MVFVHIIQNCWGHSSVSFKIVGVIHWDHSKLFGSFINIIQNCQGHLSVSFKVVRVIFRYHSKLLGSFVGIIQHCQGHSSVSFKVVGVIHWRKFQKYQTVWSCHFDGVIRERKLKNQFQTSSSTSTSQSLPAGVVKKRTGNPRQNSV